MARVAERSWVRSTAPLPPPPRLLTGRRSPDAKDFVALHAPTPEAPYRFLTAPPSLPNLRPTSQSVQITKSVEERLERRVTSNERSFQRGLKERDFRMNQRANIIKQYHQDRTRQKDRLRDTRREREARWGNKLQDSPFAVDLWAEDLDIYERNQHMNKTAKIRRYQDKVKTMAFRANMIAEACGEVDELQDLRAEKKKLIESQKELKARLDLEKVNKRMANAARKSEAHATHLENKLRSRGTLTRAHSDFFTDKYMGVGSDSEEEEEESRSVSRPSTYSRPTSPSQNLDGLEESPSMVSPLRSTSRSSLVARIAELSRASDDGEDMESPSRQSQSPRSAAEAEQAATRIQQAFRRYSASSTG